MRKVCTISGSGRLARFALAGAAAAMLAGCADSDRLASNPLGNPYATASADRQPAPDHDYRPASPSPIFSQPLPAPEQTGSLPERHVGPQYANYEAPAHESPRLAEGPVPMHAETATASIASGHGGWSAQGGMPVIAAQGETARILGERYNVPPDVLLHVNGLNASSQIHAGTRLLIPVYSASGAPVVRTAAAPAKPVVSDKPRHDHSAREKLLERKVAKAAPTAPSKAEHADVGAKKVEPVKKAEIAPKPVAPHAEPIKPIKTAKVEDVPVKKPVPAVDVTPTASLPPATPVSTAANPEFRWPARGRIIQGFKSGGNDGINIAVPEGTAVKAAESGVVAYAGSEIKGFGNLVLIRHPNGYVSAYANNGELDVKRGEQVKRGQVIAKSGQSGNVASPQLHFELRKGSTPVDPTQFLAGGDHT
ncbi:MAG: peptidoglycan DD-metalloendopeptidase family protein [Beijerinckiaceae bacterium]|nr:peptidoglycan DD-metalloendopeptidase family protein [Beijerinckiaceae bacterium]